MFCILYSVFCILYSVTSGQAHSLIRYTHSRKGSSFRKKAAILNLTTNRTDGTHYAVLE
jgi:hypothetical protein